ncbi:cytochrome c oxidase assembly protein [Microvirga lotononidis]|uniref:Putative membrane protein n=1 Tax=Microvirga lotononidis TaxID=864069 RepID=I4YYT5_9HYPH|nr:cytochrome c oxidase assembly protein [Microvirga lotononidis]EIM29127.1 putative membrane protein [Microvirga lotononidis]WQO28971.1 cytochrome c oxidase assembly protein [Microvirga lotononidis]
MRSGLYGAGAFFLSGGSAAAAQPDLPFGLLTLCLATLPETRPEQVWTAWSLSPVIVLPLALIAVLYGRGLRVLPDDERPSLTQRALFTAGIACLAVALVSPLCRMAATLAWAHMVQHVLLVAGAPLLLAMSHPGRVLLAALPNRLRMRIEDLRTDGPASQPCAYLLASFVLYGANIWFWHVPALYQGALLDAGLHVLMVAVLLAVSLLFWHVILETYRKPGPGSGLAAALLFFTFLHTAVLGLLLALSPQVWYPLMALRSAAWGLLPIDDQRLAGLIMWIPMGGVYFATALVIMGRLITGSSRAPEAASAGTK